MIAERRSHSAGANRSIAWRAKYQAVAKVGLAPDEAVAHVAG
jgi:hypothetical protein